MHVLMLTPRVDSEHDLLGFIPKWIDELSEQVDQLSVITGYKGRYDPPANVHVESYGHEEELPKWRRILRFERRCIQFASADIDVVFSHMIPMYALASWPWFGPQGIPYVQWYAHGEIDPTLRVVHRLVKFEITPASAAFTLDSDKLRVVGHGIDMDAFSPGNPPTNRCRIIGVGRVDPIKGYETTIQAIDAVVNRGWDIEFAIFGGVDGSPYYYEELQELVKRLGLTEVVTFAGSVPHSEIVKKYRQAGLVVNAGGSGSLDKVEVESMACETPMISCDTAFQQMVSNSDIEEYLTFSPGRSQELAENIIRVLQMEEDSYNQLRRKCRDIVLEEHDVSGLMENISYTLRQASGKER